MASFSVPSHSGHLLWWWWFGLVFLFKHGARVALEAPLLWLVHISIHCWDLNVAALDRVFHVAVPFSSVAL